MEGLVVLVVIGFAIFGISRLFESEQTRTARLIEARKKQARKRDFNRKIITMVHGLLSVSESDDVTIRDGELEIKYRYFNSSEYYDGESHDTSWQSFEVYFGSNSDRHLVYKDNIVGIACYIPGDWEAKFETLYERAKREQPLRSARSLEQERKKFGL